MGESFFASFYPTFSPLFLYQPQDLIFLLDRSSIFSNQVTCFQPLTQLQCLVLQQCLDLHLQWAKIPTSDLRPVHTPTLDETSFTPEDLEVPGEFAEASYNAVLKILFDSRMGLSQTWLV